MRFTVIVIVMVIVFMDRRASELERFDGRDGCYDVRPQGWMDGWMAAWIYFCVEVTRLLAPRGRFIFRIGECLVILRAHVGRS